MARTIEAGKAHSTCSFPLYNSEDSNTQHQTQSDSQPYTVKVTHQSKTVKVQINQDETILQALERSKVHDELALPSLPQECRRGNCLTCSGRLIKCKTNEESYKNVEIRKDGLSPSMAKTIKQKGIVPTCSTFVVGEGVHFELGVCDDVWRELYGNDAEGERIRNDAVAKAMRRADEMSLNRWAIKTRKMLE